MNPSSWRARIALRASSGAWSSMMSTSAVSRAYPCRTVAMPPTTTYRTERFSSAAKMSSSRDMPGATRAPRIASSGLDLLEHRRAASRVDPKPLVMRGWSHEDSV